MEKENSLLSRLSACNWFASLLSAPSARRSFFACMAGACMRQRLSPHARPACGLLELMRAHAHSAAGGFDFSQACWLCGLFIPHKRVAKASQDAAWAGPLPLARSPLGRGCLVLRPSLVDLTFGLSCNPSSPLISLGL